MVNPKAEWLLHTCITWTTSLLGLLPRPTYTRENNFRLIRKLNRHTLQYLTFLSVFPLNWNNTISLTQSLTMWWG